jgi:poly(A) polymerase
MDEHRPITTSSPTISDAEKMQSEGMIKTMGTPVHEGLAPRILTRPEHKLSRKDLSHEAIKVLYRLQRSGYAAYLVGGSVRDLLLGGRPKDFDIATNARPQEIRRLFRNSRIIGRRFRLVHVFFRGEIVEVATFRASPEPPETPDDWEEAEEEAAEEAAEEVVVADPPRPHIEEDVYGTPAEDARRRDFTINALFYNIADFSIIDHVGGIEDLERGVIRTIGDPDERFEEDPVRMMRALEYAARLGFEIDPRTAEAIDRQQALISEASTPRLTYELLECLRSGKATAIHQAWRKAGVFSRAYQDLPIDTDESVRVLEMVDAGVAAGRQFSDASLIGGFFLPRFLVLAEEETDEKGRVDNVRLLDRLREALEPAAASMHLSNQTVHLIHQGLFAVTKMRQPPERGRQVLKLARQGYFPVAWEFFVFAAALGYITPEAHQGWKRALRKVGKQEHIDQPKDPAQERPRPRTRRRPRRRRR